LRDILDRSRAPGRILLVEDEALIQMLAIQYLEEAGFTVDAAGSAAEAMNKLGLISTAIDAVIVDIGLPDQTGDVLVEQIRAAHPSLAIVIATGRGADELLHRFKGVPQVAFVTKPYTSADLLKALRGVGIHAD
jgi:DNA-binding response OmpR family regulator